MTKWNTLIVRYLFLLLFFAISIPVFSQNKVDTVYYYEDWTEGTKNFYSYYRLIFQNDDGIYEFSDYWKTGEIQNTGKYKSLDPEVKIGEWKYYHKNGKVSHACTYMENQYLIGTDKFFDSLGRLTYEYIYVVDSLDNAKEYNEVLKKFLNHLASKTKYPRYARRNNNEGRFIISLSINPEGEIFNYNITQSVSKEIDESAMKTIAAFGKFPPCIYKKRAVSTILSVPLNFRLNDNK
jgi:protein TonB